MARAETHTHTLCNMPLTSVQKRCLTKVLLLSIRPWMDGVLSCSKFCVAKLVLYRCTWRYIGREAHECPIFTGARPAASKHCHCRYSGTKANPIRTSSVICIVVPTAADHCFCHRYHLIANTAKVRVYLLKFDGILQLYEPNGQNAPV